MMSLELLLSICLQKKVHHINNVTKSKKNASDKVYQLLVHGWWFSPGIPASSTTKTDRHEIAEILLKVVLKHI
jgi:hypothetical protein